jgi:hypothetical protein
MNDDPYKTLKDFIEKHKERLYKQALENSKKALYNRLITVLQNHVRSLNKF